MSNRSGYLEFQLPNRNYDCAGVLSNGNTNPIRGESDRFPTARRNSYTSHGCRWVDVYKVCCVRYFVRNLLHYSDVIMTTMTSQITSLTAVYSIVYSDADHRKHQSSASLAFERGIHRGPVNSPHKWPVTRKIFPFDDVIMHSPRPFSSPWILPLTPLRQRILSASVPPARTPTYLLNDETALQSSTLFLNIFSFVMIKANPIAFDPGFVKVFTLYVHLNICATFWPLPPSSGDVITLVGPPCIHVLNSCLAISCCSRPYL